MDTPPAPPLRVSRSPSKLYAFAVVALATLIVMLVVCRPPVLFYIADASVRIDTAAGATPPDPQEIFAAARAGASDSPGVVVELAGHSPEGRSMLVQLAATAPTAEAAQQAVASASEAYLAAATGRHHEAEALARLRDRAREAVVTARVSRMESKRELEEFHRQHIEALEQAAQPSPTTRPNPAWESLEAQRQELVGRLESLGSSQTREHPEYRYVEGQIAAIRAQQQGIPRTLPADDTMQAIAAQRAELRQRQESLSAAAAAAEAAYNEAQRVQQQATSAAAASANAAAAITAHIEQPARVSTLEAASTSRSMLLVALALALALGMLVAVLTPKRIRQRLMVSVSEVAASLRLPLIGVLGSGAGPERPAELHGRRRVTRLLVSGGELLVLAAAVLVVVGAVAWPGWAAELRADPLSAVQQAVVRVVDTTTN